MSQNSNGSKPTIKVASKDANQRTGPADPGPGDLGAAPSTAPIPVDIPDPPTPSQLVVKSVAAGGNKSELGSSMTGSQAGPAASNQSVSSKKSGGGQNSRMETSSGAGGGGTAPQAISPTATESPTSSAASDDGVVEDEIADGEVEPASPASSVKSSSQPSTPSPVPSPSGSTKSNTSHSSTRQQSSTGFKSSGSTANALRSNRAGSVGKSSTKDSKDQEKKVTRFRYHKRITVRTTGKTNPASVMNKVSQPSINPSTIDDLDPKELLKRAGIKSSKHWRIRLRQTKRITKNGKTTTQTKTAYRDSSGNHAPPTCKKCGKSRDDCKCTDKDNDKQ